jgi:hypothetical protein
MERRRAIMIDTATGEPIDPNWQPMLAIEELPEANALMARNNLRFFWRWIPATQDIQGSVVLASC